jgi:hypothetical protein
MAQRDFNALNYMSGLGNNTSDGFIENSIWKKKKKKKFIKKKKKKKKITNNKN